MQRPSWDLLKKNWSDKYFFEPLSELISRLHENRGPDTISVVLFNTEEGELPPLQPPVHLLILYKEPVNFLRDNLFLRDCDPSGIFTFFSYGIESFRNMLKDFNPLALQALRTGLILFETDNLMEGFVFP